MHVAFYKRESKGRVIAGWDATRNKRTLVPGTAMAAARASRMIWPST
jgi:hypothetical protein